MGRALGTCLITGGFGFLGRHLVERLRPSAARLIVCSPVVDEAFSSLHGLAAILTDLRDRAETERILEAERPEVILHLASLVGAERDLEGFDRIVESNTRPLINILAACAGRPWLRRIVNFGSGEEYGPAPAPLGPSTRERPQSPYALAKLICTRIAAFYADQADVPVVTVRPTMAYGPGQDRSKFLPFVIGRALRNEPIPMTGGLHSRDLVFAPDLARAVEAIATHPSFKGGQVIDLASGTELRLVDLVNLILELAGSSSRLEMTLPYRRNEMMHMTCDRTAALSILGAGFSWTPLREGLTRTIAYYREDPNGQRNP